MDSVPYGIITCLLGDRELTVTDLSEKHVTVRMMDIKETVCAVSFCCFFWGEGYVDYGPFAVTSQQRDGLEVTFEITDPAYAAMSRRVLSQYNHYVMQKMSSETNAFSHDLVGYPSELDEDFATTYDDWRNEPERREGRETLWRKLVAASVKKSADINDSDNASEQSMSLGLELENPRLWRAFSEGGVAAVLAQEKLPGAPRITCVYIGNAWCHHLFPTLTEWEAILRRGMAEKVQLTAVLSYLQESLVEREEETLCGLFELCERLQCTLRIELNDWGQLQLLKNHPEWSRCFTYSLGRLLGKRHKDPRYAYKDGWEKGFVALERGENALNDDKFLEWLKDHGVSACELESCGYESSFPKLEAAVHLPYYQTNTSQFCPLYALCTTGNRGAQKPVERCEQYCSSFVQMYPNHLNLVGRYNSLFAIDMSLAERMTLSAWKTAGVKLVVWNDW